MTRRSKWHALLATVGLVPTLLAAQPSGGTITGRVIDRASQRPIPGANIVVSGTTLGTVTSDEGTFRIPNVAAGTAVLRALRIGYTAEAKTVAVTAGQTATVTFDLAPSAVQLDVQVVTATGQSQRQRESGATVSTIDTSKIEIAATPDLTRLLGARAPGVTVVQASGTTGTGARIRIRGSNSLSLSNDPLIIVDGIKISNDQSGYRYGVGGQTISRFEDINPNDIESLDVIKGPAGVALYGTAAANGVIQITTKRGRAGRTRWNAFAQGGSLYDPYTYPFNVSNIGKRGTGSDTTTVVNCNIQLQALGSCRDVGNIASFNPLQTYKPYSTGHNQQYGLSASGGNDLVTYRMGGAYDKEQGVIPNNYFNRIGFTGNLRAQLSRKMDAQLTTLFQSAVFALPQNENNALGYLSAGMLGKAFNCAPGQLTGNNAIGCAGDTISKGFFARDPSEFFFIENRQNNSKFTGGLTVNYQPLTWLRGTVQGGVDYLSRFDGNLTLPNRSDFNTTVQQGSASRARYSIGNYDLKGAAVATRDLPWWNIGTTTTIGAEYTQESTYNTNATGAVLLPGTGSLQGASARKDVGEQNQLVKTIGGYVREQFSSADRRFVAVGLRTDNNSAFGANSGYVYYPNAEASWVISEESFFPRVASLSQLRLRTGVGKSGQRPGFRQAQTYLNSVSVVQQGSEVPAAVVGGSGNADLKPEITTEWEGGLDVSFFNSRLGLTATYFNKNTRDALVAQPLAPSLGAATSRFVNLGLVNNKGFELQANITALDITNVQFDVAASYSNIKNKVVKLGGVPPITFNGSTQVHREGYPAGVYFQRKYTFSDANGDGLISRVNCPGQPVLAGGPACEMQVDSAASLIGSPIPTREFNLQPRLTLFRNLRLSATVDYRGGFYLWNQSREFRCVNVAICIDAYSKNAPLADQAKYIARSWATYTDPTTKNQTSATSFGYIEKADFVRLREISGTLSLPTRYAHRIGASGLSLTVAGQNLHTWTDYTGIDPEVNQASAAANFTSVDFFSQAPLRRATMRLTVDF